MIVAGLMLFVCWGIYGMLWWGGDFNVEDEDEE